MTHTITDLYPKRNEWRWVVSHLAKGPIPEFREVAFSLLQVISGKDI